MRHTLAYILLSGVLLGGAACSAPPSPALPGARAGGRASLMASGSGLARTGHAAALLGDGRVLLAGGLVGGSASQSAQIFDPGSGTFADTGALLVGRVNATATVLFDGRVLLAGGDDGLGNSLNSAELFDPASGTFSPAGALGAARTEHTATRLANGHVLVIGGKSDASSVLSSVEEYTPAAGAPGSFAPSPYALNVARAHHTASLLGSGALLVAGGEDGTGTPIVDALAAELFDPSAGSTAPASSMTARTRHTASLLSNGDVLVVGGYSGGELTTAHLYRVAQNDFVAAPDLGNGTPAPRADATSTLLPDGRVVVAGGENGGSAVSNVDVYASDASSESPVGHLAVARSGQVATLLPSGRILLTGGGLGSAEVLDRALDQWTVICTTGACAGAMANYVPAYGHTSTLLVNGPDAGKVLEVGGIDPVRGYLASAQLFDPVAKSVTALPSMGSARVYHTATLLASGDVLIAGGSSGPTNTLATAQLYRAATRTWSTVSGSMNAPRSAHTATLLATGHVLLAGGDNQGTSLNTAEVYDPVADAFAPVTNTMSAPRAHHAASLLRPGSVLVVGGDGTATADVYDPTANAFSPVGSMVGGVRAHFTATPLSDGRVLVAGGTDGSVELGTAELFDGTASFAATPGTLTPRLDHAAAALPTGEVILAGGQDASGYLTIVERYEPESGLFIQSGVSPLNENRDLHSLLLLPSNELLAWGGDDGTRLGPDPELYDAFATFASTPPGLTGGMPLGPQIPGGLVSYTPAAGASFVGFDTGSSDTGSSPANSPVFVLSREGGDGIAFARTASYSAGGAQVELPTPLPAGWWWVRAIVSGVPGRALPFYLLTPFVLSPQNPTVPPRGTVTFTAQGGGGSPYTFSLGTTGSNSPATPGLPSVSAAGAYQAGGTGNSADVVEVTDALGNTISTQVNVSAGVTITGPGQVPPRGTAAYTAQGGSGAGYVWSFPSGGNQSGASLNASTGAYTAGPAGGVTDTIEVTDSLGNTAQAQVYVMTPLIITPNTVSTTPLGSQRFDASGGSLSGYTYTIFVNSSGGTIDPASGAYQAGRTGSCSDTVRVTDSYGNTADATVTVGPAVTLTPSAPAAPPRGPIAFVAAGGTGTGFTFTLATNVSGGSIDATTGAYTAGATPNVIDVVKVTDSLGNFATATVAIGPGITIAPADPGAYPGQTVTLTASGGSGTGFTWSMVTVNSNGGSIGATTGVYTAGTTRGVSDVVQVTDSLGNLATVDVVVWPDWKPSGSGCSSPGGGAEPAGLFLVLLWIALRGRPRRALRALLVLAILGVGAARAQAPPVTTSFVVNRFQPTGGAYDLLGVESAQVAGHLESTIRAYGSYGNRPLVVGAPGMSNVALLKSQSALDLTLSMGLLEWAEVSAVVSGVVSQGQEQSRYLPPELKPSVASSGLSDARIIPKARLLDQGKLRLGLAAPVGLPTGNTNAYLGQGGFTVNPNVLFELDALGPARALVNAGAIFRQQRQLVDLTVGNAFTYGAGVEWPFRVAHGHLSALATLGGEVGMKDSAAAARPMELLGALRFSSPRGLLVSLGGGPGIGKGYGTPEYRVLAEVGFSTAGLDRLRETEPVARAEEPKAEEERAEPQKPEEPAPAVAKAEEPKAEEPKPEEAKAAEPLVAKVEPPPETAKVAPEGTLRIDSRVFFDFNKKEIKPEYRGLLRRIAKRIVEEPRMRVVRIEGHADDLGPLDYNLWLSEERARAVKDFLQKNGVPASRIAVVGYGKTRPLAPGRSSTDRAKNRRVEFNVQEE